MIENPLFIVGTERSGSNLLRLILSELPELAIPHPPHLMRDLSKVVSRYGDLQRDASFRQLIRDAVRLVELHFAPWPLSIDAERIFQEARSRDLYSVYACIYDQYREWSGKPRWGCKSTFMIGFVQDILTHHRKPQFLHLVRDVRDVAVSARRSIFCHYHPYYVSKLWAHEQALAQRWSAELGPKAWMTVRYEDLLKDPESTVRDVCTWLGSEYKPNLLRFFDKPEAVRLSGLSRSWENVGRPILQSNTRKFLENFSMREIEIIESVAWPQMQSYGYDFLTPANARCNVVDRFTYTISEWSQMVKEEVKSLILDRNARFRLRRKAFLWSLSRSRRSTNHSLN